MVSQPSSASQTVPTSASPLATWLSYLEQIHSSEIDMGLERTAKVAEQLAVLRPARYVITVGGTNGKGSTVTYLEQMLKAAGYRTGVYSSPHLYRYAERVRIDGALLDDSQHSEAFAAVQAARADTSLTYFEFGTLAALWLFQQQALDVVILEVGLGGRLDAVNVVDADVAVVTSIGIDHIGFLGDNRESIGREKAGIFRAGRAAICGDPEPPISLLKQAQDLNCDWRQVGKDFSYQQQSSSWHYHSQAIQLPQLPMPQLPLANAATAIAALEALPLAVSAQAIAQGLSHARLAGRLQLLAATENRPDCLLDVAHNPHAATFLADYLKQYYPQRRFYAVVGMLADKDIEGTLAALHKPLAAQLQQWFFASLSQPRGASAAQLQSAYQQLASDTPATIHDGVEQALTTAQQLALRDATRAAERGEHDKPLVLVFGSFYTVGQVLAQQGAVD
ncbi:bifunctional tetrahydrofolate synthase/dihydrofolate synthase [Idiomarina xiamenensis]|uniref:Dihydrofolate synthase/folylpolyglutamate synthase n=1 Tax=Idiomarina xiamenensis 10-D-4 TaxID=740709 RepID=K2JK53_9GAMM|nr:bifunctional tetrahydrofolate synthase/dihydrofolate synthase [Idiomarina xiamenensis]EKE83836.1 folylpolyglutamate synthase [Idiomarina xiamenensis 10-D-4]